jgi:hypothetical protein
VTLRVQVWEAIRAFPAHTLKPIKATIESIVHKKIKIKTSPTGHVS